MRPVSRLSFTPVSGVEGIWADRWGECCYDTHVAQYLARFKVPRWMVFQAALPKNWTENNRKRPLREEFASFSAA